eukprot:3727101-Amphidinium_carterae.2
MLPSGRFPVCSSITTQVTYELWVTTEGVREGSSVQWSQCPCPICASHACAAMKVAGSNTVKIAVAFVLCPWATSQGSCYLLWLEQRCDSCCLCATCPCDFEIRMWTPWKT